MAKERQQYETTTTNVLVATIVIIILGIGATSIGLSGQATRNANDGIFPFSDLLNVQPNISYFESNYTQQITTLAQLTQHALALTVVGGPPNRTLISSGYARLYSGVWANPVFNINYADLEGYPNTTWQLYSSELHFGFIIYVLHIDPVISDNIVYENVVPIIPAPVNSASYSMVIVLDTTNLFPDSGLGVTSFTYVFIPNPFTVTGCNIPSECIVHPTLLAYFTNPETSSVNVGIRSVFSPVVPLPQVNVTFTPTAMMYFKIS